MSERDALEAEVRYHQARKLAYDAALAILLPHMTDDGMTVEDVMPLLTPEQRRVVEVGLGEYIKVPKREVPR